MFRHLIPIAVLSLLAAATSARCNGTATYRLTIRNTWTAARFGPIPSFAHFSPLTFFSHSPRFSSFVLRGYATPGVQEVAELGINTVLLRELRTAGDFVLDTDVSDGDAFSGESFSASVKVDCERPFVSAITMIAPSPDWIIGLANVDLLRNGKFTQKLTGELRVYDAGTDSGETLTAPNKETVPRENIAPLKGMPFRGRSVANYVLQRIAV